MKKIKPHFLKDLDKQPITKTEKAKIEIIYQQYRKELGKKAQAKNPETGENLRREALYEKEAEIIELFGQMYTAEEVKAVLKEQFDIDTTTNTLLMLARKNGPVIAEKVQQFKVGYTGKKLANKAGRIMELEEMFYELKALNKAAPTNANRDRMTNILEALRKETDGDILNVSVDPMTVNVHMHVENHFKMELMHTINLKALILNRIGAKTGVDINVLEFSLFTSYYSQLNQLQAKNGIGGEMDGGMEGFKYPGMLGYEPRELQPAYAARQEEIKKIQETNPVSAADADTLAHIKQKLLQSIGAVQHQTKQKMSVAAALAAARGKRG